MPTALLSWAGDIAKLEGSTLAEQIPGPLGRPRPWRSFWVRNLRPAGTLFGLFLPRLFDLLIALALLLLLSPLLLLRALAGRLQAGQALERELRIGRYRTLFEQLRFAGPLPGGGAALLINVLRGDLAFAGPRPLRPEECAALPPEAQPRFAVRPGLVSAYRVQRGTGIAHEAEHVSDVEFAYAESLKGNLGLLLRGTAVSALKGAERPAPPMLDFFGIDIVNTTMDEAVAWMLQQAGGTEAQLMAFVNPDCLNIAYTREDYRSVLQQASRVLPDGIGIHVGCRLLGTSLRANVNGTDLFPRLCAAAEAPEGPSLFLLGAQPGIAEMTARNMKARFPSLRIAGTQHGFFKDEEEEGIINRINASGAGILLVAFGAPRQELWLARNRERLKPGVIMGVGGLFDFYSGRISRAPQWLRELGLEWTWRLLQEPGRMWRRYIIGNPLFLWRVLRQARGSEGARA